MAKLHIITGLIVCFIAWVFFLIFPHLDITLAGHFYNQATDTFSGNNSSILTFLHIFAMKFPVVFSIVVILFMIFTFFKKNMHFKYKKEILFVAVCLWVGPGIIVNVIFKDHWGRPRPVMVQEFGGDKVFQQPFVISNQCGKNCSFVCGDASMGFWLFALMPLAVTRRRKILAFSVAVIAGGGLGMMRMAQGGHFFSDVIFCGIFVYLSTWIVYSLMYRKKVG